MLTSVKNMELSKPLELGAKHVPSFKKGNDSGPALIPGFHLGSRIVCSHC